MIEYILNGQPIKVRLEDRELFEKNNPTAKLKSATQDGAQINLQTGNIKKVEPGKSQGTSQSQNNQQQINTESNLGDGFLESPKNDLEINKNKVDSLNNVIQSFNYEAKLEQIEKQINEIASANYKSGDNLKIDDANKKIEILTKDYNNLYTDYLDKYNEYDIARKNYNKLIGQSKEEKTEKQEVKKPKINLSEIGVGFATKGLTGVAEAVARPYLKNKILRAGEGAVSMINNFVKGYETGEVTWLDPMIDDAFPFIKKMKVGAKLLESKGIDVPDYLGPISLDSPRERRERYESFMLEARDKGIPLEQAQKLDPTNRIKLEGVLDWFDKHTYKRVDENGDPLDYMQLFGKAKSPKDYFEATDAFLDDVFGAIPSLIVSRIPYGIGPAFMGTGMYMDNFERELYKRGINDETTRNQIVKDSWISGSADFVTELVGGRVLNKIIGSGIPKEKAKDLLTQLPKVIAKKLGFAGVTEFATEGAAGWLNLKSDEWSYDEEYTTKEKFRAFIRDGFIGMFLGTGAASTSIPNKKDVYAYVSPQTFKQDQLKIEQEILDLTRDVDNATGKSKDILNKKIKDLKNKKKQNEKNLFDFFENLTDKEKQIYANNLDAQGEQLDILFDKRHSKKTREEAVKKYDEAINANNNFFDGTDINYDPLAEKFIGTTLRASEKIRKNKNFFGFNKSNLDIEYVESDARLKELSEQLPGFEESDGLFFEQKDGKNKIYINTKVASMTGQTNVLGHEYLHAIVSNAFSEGIGASNLKGSVTSFKEYLIKTGNEDLVNRIERRLARQYGGRNAEGEIIRDDHGLVKTERLKDQEEYFNIFSDIISKEKIEAVESKSAGIKNSFRALKRGFGFGEVDFQSGQEVFDFLVDYNTNMRRASLLGTLTSKGIAKVSLKGLEAQIDEQGKSDVIKDEEGKASKSAKKSVDDLGSKTKWNKETWKEEGADQAIKDIKSKGLIDGLIAAKYKVRPVPKNFVNDVLNSNFFVNHVRSFNPEVNDSLFGWINSQIRNKAGSVFNQNEKGKMPKGVKAVELDAVTTEGKARTEVADTDVSMETLTDNINYFETEVQPENTESKTEQSKLRKEIGIGNLGKGEIFKKVRTALATSKAVDEKGFIKDYEKNLGNLLEPTIARILNDPAKLKKFRKGILEAIPIKTLVQMQKFLPEKIFIKDHGRQTNLTNLSKFVEKGLLPADILNNTPESKKRRAAGVKVYERLNTTTKQFENYIDAEAINPKTGKRSGTRGNNRAKVISEVSKAIGKDATPETLTPEFIEDYLNIKDLKGKITPEKVIENINEQIERSANLKFSKNAIIYKKHANLNTKQLITELKKQGVDIKVLEVITKLEEYFGGKNKNVLKKRKLVDFVKSSKLAKQIREDLGGFLSQHPQYIPYFQASMASGYGNSLFGVKDVFYSVTGLTPKKIEKLLSRFEYAKGKKLDPDKVKLMNGELKFKKGRKWISQKEFLKDNKARWDFIEDMFTDIRNYIQTKPSSASVFALFAQEGANTQNHAIKIMSPLVAIPKKNNKVMYIPIREEHGYPQNDISTILLAEAILPDGNIKDAMKVVRASYSQWGLDLDHDSQIDAMGYGSKMPDFFYDVIVPKLIKGDLDYLPPGVLGPIVRYVESNIDLNNYHLISENKTVTEYFGVNVKGLDDVQMQHIVPVQNEAIKRILSGEINKKKAKEEVQAAASIKHSKSPLDIKKINNAMKAKNNIIKFSKNGKAKGMSTFDFDETLIIDGENFVIATNPLTGQEIEISSADWPVKGPELMAEGYEMNFDDFVNVRGGVDGPLLQKMKNQIKKYGVENVFILTARPQSADVAIHEWLKSKDINIPFKNITGLGDSTGQAKADWMLEKFADGYNDMYFVDDALSNVEAVKNVLDQLDIKSKVVQAKTKVKVGGFLVDVTTKEGRDFIKQYNEIETVSTTDPDLANRKIKFSKSAKQTADKLMDKFNKEAEKVRKTIKILEDDLRSKGYTINPTSQSSEFKRIGGWIIDTTTKEGKEFVRDLENIPTVSSSDPGRVTKFSKSPTVEFNEILEQTKRIKAGKIFSAQEARKIGVKKGRLNFFVPPSAEDFKGLIYSFLGKGREGDAHAAFFKEHLFDPFAKGIREWNTYKQTMSDDYKALKKEFKGIGKILNNKVKGTVFTNDNAVRVYLWNKAGFEIPGVSEKQIKKLVNSVENNPKLKAFAESLSVISRIPEGYIEPEGYWAVQSIASDLSSIVLNKGRKDFLAEWIENKNIIFSEQNLNKIEAIYGTGFREALEDMLTRMETGRNRKDGKSKIVNMFLDWINGSVAATMFFNNRSAALQTISTVNFINAADNNIFKAAAAFANQPQFWKDFVFIFNSPMLKQRRAGLQIDVSASEITRAFNEGKSKPEAALAYLLEIGFTPTQIADSFAIAMGGATFYRNRLNKYIKEGMSEAKAKEQTWLDFQEIAEETQQSSRPDLISMQQAGVLGRIILAWQNTPMQMTRLMKKKLSDLVNRRRIPGYTQVQSDVANMQGIMYYGVVQNLIFGALQTGLMFMLFGWDDDQERKEKLELRTLNGALDTILRGTGVYGAAISTLKNVLMKWKEESEKPMWKRDDWNIAQEAINLSPPIGSKMRKIMSSIRTEKWNKGVSKEIGFRIENPTLSIVSNWVEGITNFPMARMQNKVWNVEEALNSNNETWQRVLIGSGWSRWSVGVVDEELEKAKTTVKQKREAEKKATKDAEKAERKRLREIEKKEEKKKEEQEKKKKGIKTVRCSGKNSGGKRCGLTTETNKKSWKCFHHSTFKDGQDRDGDGVKEYQCTGMTKSGKRCRNKGEYKGKKKRCYAHQ